MTKIWARISFLSAFSMEMSSVHVWFLLLVLAPYKYAGYPQLLRTARLEAAAEQLFAARDAAPLLPAACELAHATVRCSALNAEELRREGGLQVPILLTYRNDVQPTSKRRLSIRRLFMFVTLV